MHRFIFLALLVLPGLRQTLVAQGVSRPCRTSTVAGMVGVEGGTDGIGVSARFDWPAGIAVDVTGNAYVADTSNDAIRKITPAGLVTTLAGTAGDYGGADGPGCAARFNSPYGVAADASGNVYVADTGNDAIRKITPAGLVTTLAGQAGSSGSADGTGRAARFNWPSGVAVDGAGNVYVADNGNDTIRKITPIGMVTTLAGMAGHFGRSDGVGGAARFSNPYGVAVDASGNVYVADTYNHTIRKATPWGVVTTLAGAAGHYGSADGTGHTARFSSPTGVTVDASGNVYVADSFNDTIREITPAGAVRTLMGTAGRIGSADGVGRAVRFTWPTGVAVDAWGVLYVTDSQNNTIRKCSFSAAPPD